MRRWMSIPALFAVLAGATLSATVSSASGAPAAAAKPRIASVVFTGSATKPVLTVTGTGFGKAPATDPAWRPAKYKLCTKKEPTGVLARFGWDYGTKLFLVDQTQKPNWSAGRYVVKPKSVDCIGVIITSYSTTKVVFHLGAAYPHYPGASARYVLAAGDTYQVGVGSARYVAKVKYTKPKAKK